MTSKKCVFFFFWQKQTFALDFTNICGSNKKCETDESLWEHIINVTFMCSLRLVLQGVAFLLDIYEHKDIPTQ